VSGPAVYLIGAGPGDPGLITVRGLEALRTADVVIHDHVIPTRLLDHARAGAELIDVGRATSQTMAQEAISLLVLEKAREGRVVARLKWGDPFVFDRGGEEALFLREHEIPFEIVPGVPAGIAVPAYAGVPITYPGGGDTITLVRGYENESRTLPDIDWSSLARLSGTVVCYAGAQQLPQILEALRSSGWPGEDQAVIVYNGTMSNQHSLAGTIDDLLRRVREHIRREPAILVVGRVAGFREHLRWFDSRPLFGRRVLVTRPREQAADLVARLSALGAEAIQAPLIRIAPPDDPSPLHRAAASPDQFDVIVFTSANAVQAFMDALLQDDRDIRALKGPLLCAVGSSTAARLAAYGIKVDVVPEEFRAEAVVAALSARVSVVGARVLLPRSDIGRDVIAEQLGERGAIVTEVIAYRTIAEEAQPDEGPDVYGMLLEGRIDAVTFTSPSAVRTFARIYGAEQTVDLLRNTVVASIGPVTTEAATGLGLTVAVQPTTYTVPALVEAISAHFSRE
jgi:uroporphyrinogen III methyltransferase / synthase